MNRVHLVPGNETGRSTRKEKMDIDLCRKGGARLLKGANLILWQQLTGTGIFEKHRGVRC